MPKQPGPPSPSKPVPASWWFLTGGVGPPPRTQAGFHRLASERKAAYRAEVTAKRERKEAEQAREDALARLEEEHAPPGRRQQLGRKQLMEKFGPSSGVKAGRAR